MNKTVTYGVMDAERDDSPEGIRVLIEDPQALCENVGRIPSKIQVRLSTHRRQGLRVRRVEALLTQTDDNVRVYR